MNPQQQWGGGDRSSQKGRVGVRGQGSRALRCHRGCSGRSCGLGEGGEPGRRGRGGGGRWRRRAGAARQAGRWRRGGYAPRLRSARLSGGRLSSAAGALQRARSAPRRAPPTPPRGGRALARRGREEKAPPESGIRYHRRREIESPPEPQPTGAKAPLPLGHLSPASCREPRPAPRPEMGRRADGVAPSAARSQEPGAGALR